MLDARLDQQPVNHDLDRVIPSLVQGNIVFEVNQFAIDPRPGEAVLQ